MYISDYPQNTFCEPCLIKKVAPCPISGTMWGCNYIIWCSRRVLDIKLTQFTLEGVER